MTKKQQGPSTLTLEICQWMTKDMATIHVYQWQLVSSQSCQYLYELMCPGEGIMLMFHLVLGSGFPVQEPFAQTVMNEMS